MMAPGPEGGGTEPSHQGSILLFVSTRTVSLVRLGLNGFSFAFGMDLVATTTDVLGLYRLTVRSVLGALWLQTHFPDSEWDALLEGTASFGLDCLNALIEDARSAGLAVEQTAVVES